MPNAVNGDRSARSSFVEFLTTATSCTGLSCGTDDKDKKISSPTGSKADYIKSKTSVALDTNCGMQRASVSRRTDNLQSPPNRSRSEERLVEPNNNHMTMSPNVDVVPKDAYLQSERPGPLDRAVSDLFDAQEDYENKITKKGSASTEEETTLSSTYSGSDSSLSLPTLPRYPVAETRNTNCWSEPPVSIFSVRGSNYFVDKKKITSAQYLFEARGSDILLSDAAETVDFSRMSNSILGGQLRKKPTLAIIFHFPWGFMNLYFEFPASLTRYVGATDTSIDDSLSPAERTVALWLLGDREYKNERLKLVPYVAEGPWAVRSLVTGRPALIGKKLPVSYDYYPSTSAEPAPLLTATLDIGNSSSTAKRIVSVCRRYMSALTVDVGFVIQAELSEELPERMLGAVRVHGPDPLKAPKINGQH